jgi:hypothetical protein
VQITDAVDALPMLFQTRLADYTAVLLEREEGRAAPAASGTVEIVRDEPTEIQLAVDAAGPGMLVLLDAWSPDWRATVDGAPVGIRHANYLGRAIHVPSGRHDVTFRFSSRPFQLGATITLLALAATLGWWGRELIVRRRRVWPCTPPATR